MATRKVTNAWRERGYDDANAKREKRIPDGIPDDCRTAYLTGFRFGDEERRRREGDQDVRR